MLSEEEKTDIVRITQKWVETIIIGLNLCPFAKAPFQNSQIRYTIADYKVSDRFIERFEDELIVLERKKEIETTLLIVPALEKVEHFQLYFQSCEEVITFNGWGKKYQIVSFHPLARFSEFSPDDPKNLTAMAPYPMVHILRVNSVESLGASLKADVQVANDKTLEKLTHQEMEDLWKKVIT